ncbi:MAG: hypothetical protein AAB911_01805 [Patescibacteria group bacterium]
MEDQKENIISPESQPAESPEIIPPVNVEIEKSTEQEPSPVLGGQPVQDNSNVQSQQIPATEEELQQHIEHIAPLPEEEKLWNLKLMARDHGLEKAIAVLKKMDDPWLEDKFHDDLMDDPEWRAQLEALGKIEKL